MNAPSNPNRWAAAWIALGLSLVSARAADTKVDDFVHAVGGLLDTNLTVNLKGLTGTDGEDGTFGVDYKFAPRVMSRALGSSGLTTFSLSLHSEGLVTFDSKKSPHRLLTHGLRISLDNLFSSTLVLAPDTAEVGELARGINHEQFLWEQARSKLLKPETSPEEREALVRKMDDALKAANQAMATNGVVMYRKIIPGTDTNYPGLSSNLWYVVTEPAKPLGAGDRSYGVEPLVPLAAGPAGAPEPVKQSLSRGYVHTSPVTFSWDLDGNAETDQTFTDVQYVGATQARLLFTRDWFDLPFAFLRGHDVPIDPKNRLGGPYVYGGIGIVDPSGNESRKKLLGDENDPFARVQAGVNFRTELWQIAGMVLGLELDWRYYYEIDAPQLIRDKRLDNTSYFRAAVLFPKGLFVEYTDGKLPLDLQNAQTIAAGWRANF